MFQVQRTNRPIKFILTAAVTSLLLAGCGGAQTPTPTTPDPSSTASEPTTKEPAVEPTQSQSPDAQWTVQTSVATYEVQSDNWNAALLEGNLMLLDTGCLVVREQAGENAFIPVFPVSHEAVEFDGVTLRLGTQEFSVGSEISLGGSALEWTEEYPELNYTMPDSCSGLDTWWASPQNL